MKRKITLTFAAIAAATSIYAQDIKLPSPHKNGGLPINRTLAERHSEREFNPNKTIPLQTVSDLLWATCGINRSENSMRTNPTVRNFQEIDAYWFEANGVYLYDFKNNILVEKAKGDYRALVAGTSQFKQDFVMNAPASIVLVADSSKAGMTCALIDAGIACENINLFCAGNGLATVPRMTMDVNGIQQLLSLPDTSLPVMNNPVGYSK